MGKNEKEMQILYEWSVRNGLQNCFRTIDREASSYFIKRETDTGKSPYIREYGFESMPEFMNEIDVLWDGNRIMTEIKKAVGVAAMKNKPSKVVSENVAAESKKETEDKLPAFIYNF